MFVGPEEFEVERAAGVLKEAREIERNKELLNKVLKHLEDERENIEETLELFPEDLREEHVEESEDIDPDDEGSRISKFISRIKKDRVKEARDTNESPAKKRKRMENNRGRFSQFD